MPGVRVCAISLLHGHELQAAAPANVRHITQTHHHGRLTHLAAMFKGLHIALELQGCHCCIRVQGHVMSLCLQALFIAAEGFTVLLAVEGSICQAVSGVLLSDAASTILSRLAPAAAAAVVVKGGSPQEPCCSTSRSAASLIRVVTRSLQNNFTGRTAVFGPLVSFQGL